jgi:hypothetical protein
MPRLLREEVMLRRAGQDRSPKATSRYKWRGSRAFIQHLPWPGRDRLRFFSRNLSFQTNARCIRQFTAEARIALHISDLI